MSAYQKTAVQTAEQLVEALSNFLASMGWSVVRDPSVDENYEYIRSGWWGHRIVTPPNPAETPLEDIAQPMLLAVYDSTGDFFMRPARVSGATWEFTGYAAFLNESLENTDVHFLGYTTPSITYAILKLGTGSYRQLAIGRMEKFGSFTGGTLFYISNHDADGDRYCDRWPSGWDTNRRLFGTRVSNGGLYVENGEGDHWRPWDIGRYFTVAWNDRYDPYPFKYLRYTGTYYSAFCGVSDGGSAVYDLVHYFDKGFYAAGNSQSYFNFSVHLTTLQMFLARPNDMISPIGYAPHIRMTKSSTLTPEAVITVGGDQWRCFPVIRDAVPSAAAAGSYDYYYCFYIDVGQETVVEV